MRTFEPLIALASVLLFAVAFMLGQQTTSREAKKHYIVDASEVEVVYNDPYKNLTLDTCRTDYECNIAHLLDDQANGLFLHKDDPIFFSNNIPIIEPIDCEPKDRECLKQNVNAGKPAHSPSACEPYIFSNL